LRRISGWPTKIKKTATLPTLASRVTYTWNSSISGRILKDNIGMIELRWETGIRASAELVFSLLAELRDYDRWLPRSTAFKGTTQISKGPIAVGTTYIERSPLGTRNGRVTRLDRPTHLNFEQPMTIRPRLFGVIGIQLFHTLTPGIDSVHLLRLLQLSPRGPVKLVMPHVVRAFRMENERMIGILKEFAEKEARGDIDYQLPGTETRK
jgi:uncharacterized protein YndB with AHSA1/START domain